MYDFERSGTNVMDRAGLLDEIGRDHIYPRVSDAVDALLIAEGL